jgi:LmbE family N-acetylglucosaminyl deacetylase
MNMALNNSEPFGVSGTPLTEWQASPALHGVRPITLAELVPSGARLVVLAPHPDDEILACGGLLAGMVERQNHVQLISVTDGEGSHPDSPQWPQMMLRLERRKESERAVARLGFDVPRLCWQRLGLTDGQVADRAESLIALLTEDLRPNDILITTWRHDGHCDHEAVGHCAAQAAANTGATLVEIPVWAWHWAEPGDPRIPWSHARKVILNDEQQRRKAWAVEAHATQLQADASTGAGPVLSANTLDRLLQPFELVFL